MPFCEVNKAQIYYQIYGTRSEETPVLLIHGSTLTGEDDWGQVAPLLGRDRQVVVPDCRGHGNSSNPNLTYRFDEMASDMASLVVALGLDPIHVIGHSNGGNVALCILVDHPNVVKKCVLQAANAYVSSDLVERQPGLFDPDRVAVESPGWVEQMITLHGAVHGRDYWRDLLRITVAEIIRAPNYSSEELSRIDKPVLVIQGENDGVNRTGQHAQFIAQHIPQARLWIPKGIGHTVHSEIPTKWLEEITHFLKDFRIPV